MRTVKTLIRLGGCQADLSLHMPFCWFCHKAGHISFLCILFCFNMCLAGSASPKLDFCSNHALN